MDWCAYFKHSTCERSASNIPAEQTLEQQKAMFAAAQAGFEKARQRR